MADEVFWYFHPTDNVAPNATLSTTGTADSAYPVSRATDFSPAYIAAPSLIEETSGTWVGDFGAPQRVDVAVIQINADEGVQIFFEMHASNSWTSPTVQGSVFARARRADGHVYKLFLDVRQLSGYSTSGLRYFRWRVSAANAEALGIKFQLFGRAPRQLPDDYQWGIVDIDIHTAIVMETDAGVRWPYAVASGRRSLKGSLVKSDAAAEQVRELVRAAGGPVGLVTMIPDPSNVNDVWVGHLTQDSGVVQQPSLVNYQHQTQRDFIDVNRIQLGLIEAAIGDPEWT